MKTPPLLPARMVGVVRSPRATFEAVAAAPRWAGVLLVTFLATAAPLALLLETEVGRLALLDQWERTALAFGQQIDDAQYAAMQEATRAGAAYAVIGALLSGPALAVVLSAILAGVFRVATGQGPGFRHVFAVVAHAGVILALRQVIAAPATYLGETFASPVTLRLLFRMLDETSMLARFFSFVDLFVIWWIAVLAVGLAVLYRRPARRLVLVFVGIYMLLAVILVLVTALSGGAA